MKRDIYEAITERFIEQLKRGTVPWQKPWFAVQNLAQTLPRNQCPAPWLDGPSIPFWISFKQTLDLGGHVRKSEKSTLVIYYKILAKRDEAGNMMVREDGRPLSHYVRPVGECFQSGSDGGHPDPVTSNHSKPEHCRA